MSTEFTDYFDFQILSLDLLLWKMRQSNTYIRKYKHNTIHAVALLKLHNRIFKKLKCKLTDKLHKFSVGTNRHNPKFKAVTYPALS